MTDKKPNIEIPEFDTIDVILEAIKRGEMVIVVDDENRENEGDLVMAGQWVTAEAVTFMARLGGGLICVPTTESRLRQLGISEMVPDNRDSFRTDFQVSVDAAKGITTGISGADRARTVQVMSEPTSVPSDLAQPGHIFPLRAKSGGVLQRAGHTEAACDLARLAGLEEAGVICEIMNDDGSMARRDDLMKFSSTHEMKIGTIADLIQYRALKEKSVHLEYSKPVEINGFEFELSAWRDSIFDNLHLAFIKGDLSSSDAPLVRVHIPNTLHDLIGVKGFGKRLNLEKALERIGKEECGVLLLIGNYQDANEVMHDLKGTKSQLKPETKTVGIGSQILKELGLQKIKLLGTPVKYPSLSGFDLEVTGFEQ